MNPFLPPLDALPAPDFDLAATLNCGQVFHWQALGAGWVGTLGGTPVYVEQRGGELLASGGEAERVSRYLALDHPLADIRATFPADPAMRAAADACRGLRILRQPLWECLATFITSAMKQVAHIRVISHHLRRCYGEKAGEIGGLELFAYPTPAALAALEEADLRAAGLGWRAKTLLGAARAVRDGATDLEAIRELPYPAAHRALCAIPGVGPKVANCALLFAYERLEAFPIDVWIERVLREQYFPGRRRVTTGQLQEFARTYFGPFGGYAQQYLFHHARTTKARSRRVPRAAAPAANP